MNQFDLTSIYLTILFILPGFISYTIYKSLHKFAKQDSDLVIIFKSLLHSGLIYVVCYLAYRVYYQHNPVIKVDNGSNILQLSNHIIAITMIIAAVSVIWGLALYLVVLYQPHLRFLAWFGIQEQLRPPNLYSSVFDPRYNLNVKENGCYIVFNCGGEIKEGWVQQADVGGNDRLLLINGISVLNRDREIVYSYPESISIILDLSKTEWLEIAIEESQVQTQENYLKRMWKGILQRINNL